MKHEGTLHVTEKFAHAPITTALVIATGRNRIEKPVQLCHILCKFRTRIQENTRMHLS